MALSVSTTMSHFKWCEISRKTCICFYLSELECGLIAPKLAFEKNMPAPSGKQFKITGNVVNVPADVTNILNLHVVTKFTPRKLGQLKFN